MGDGTRRRVFGPVISMLLTLHRFQLEAQQPRVTRSDSKGCLLQRPRRVLCAGAVETDAPCELAFSPIDLGQWHTLGCGLGTLRRWMYRDWATSQRAHRRRMWAERRALRKGGYDGRLRHEELSTAGVSREEVKAGR
jgi:hypothetical protein